MDGDHGRIETSTRLVCTEVAGIQKPHQWPGLAEIGRVIRTRDTASSGDRERLLPAELGAALSPEHLGQVARSHWGVENRLHWVLNAVMHEDATRNRNDNSAYNLAILRHRALNLMQRDRWRVSLPSKFNLAAWKDEFLARLLRQFEKERDKDKMLVNFDTFCY